MSINIQKLKKLNEYASMKSRRKHTIVLNPEKKDINNLNKDDITYDASEWIIPETIEAFIEELSKDKNLSEEEKILLVYEKICKDYVYDDNLISYIKKIDDDTYSLPDWYGRDIDDEWRKNRENHNRRICFELSRYMAKSLKKIFKDRDDVEICILWSKENTHYLVGLICDDYSITLDTDDFFKIKDLTRLKTGLTIEGIDILNDKNSKFTNELNKFNECRSEYALKKMENEININRENLIDDNESQEINYTDDNAEIEFLKNVMEILITKYDIDSQGIFEYLKEIIDIKLGQEKRKKIWKKIEGNTTESTRYIRCLILDMDKEKYLIDVDKRIIRPFNEEELKARRPAFVDFKELSRGFYDYYDGT